MELNAADFSLLLNAEGIELYDGATIYTDWIFTDETPDYLADESGDFLGFTEVSTGSAIILNAEKDDFNLNTE